MDPVSYKLQIVMILTVGLGLATFFGYLAHRFKVSPLLGYLLAGFLIGPYSPFFVADLETSEKLAEIGIILMMLSVGMNFKLEELYHVKNVAIPAAQLQTLITASITCLCVAWAGWPIVTGLMMGLSIGVASTVVLVRTLEDHHLLKSPEGHLAVGWVIVEDMMTIGLLIIIPEIIPLFSGGDISLSHTAGALVMLVLKVLFLAVGMLTVGQKAIDYLLSKISATESHELFTVAILATTFIITTGSSYFFGTSIALGAFIAGMVIGQTKLSHEAAAHSMGIRDAFLVIFFLSIGMLFSPEVIVKYPLLFLIILSAILLLKPLVAATLIKLFKYPVSTALFIGFALAQVGEFSIILSGEALRYRLIPMESHEVVIAAALVTIGINPILINLVKKRE